MASTNRAADANNEDVYELTPIEAAEPIPHEWRAPATYTLEMALRCPYCDSDVRVEPRPPAAVASREAEPAVVGEGPWEIEDISFHDALVLTADTSVQLQVNADAGRGVVQVMSRPRSRAAPESVIMARRDSCHI